MIDLVFNTAHFILIHTTVTTERIARLFLHYMWKLHGFSTYVISDRSLQFIILFTKEFYYLFGVKIALFIVWYL